MKKRTLIILSCLVSTGAMAENKVEFIKSSNSKKIEKKFQLTEDSIFEELKSRGIVSEIPGFSMPLVNYGLMAKELKKAGQKDEDVVFVLENMKEAFDQFALDGVKTRNLTETLDQMGLLEKNDRKAGPGTICM